MTRSTAPHPWPPPPRARCLPGAAAGKASGLQPVRSSRIRVSPILLETCCFPAPKSPAGRWCKRRDRYRHSRRCRRKHRASVGDSRRRSVIVARVPASLVGLPILIQDRHHRTQAVGRGQGFGADFDCQSRPGLRLYPVVIVSGSSWFTPQLVFAGIKAAVVQRDRGGCPGLFPRIAQAGFPAANSIHAPPAGPRPC